ncbi:hypothetical protein ACWD26_29245 [Streptomyces sp. NPDC002787]
MYARVCDALTRRFRRLERDGFMWRRGYLVVELEPYNSPVTVTVRREARPDCHRCQGTGSLYEQIGTDHDRRPYYDYAGPCPHCPEYPRLYMTARGRVAAAFRIALLARPSEWRREPKPTQRDWRDEPPF